MAEESNEKFWQFLETVRELTIYKQGDSEYSYYNLILKKAGQFLSNLQINLLKFAFSIRAYSPTIQMFQQIAADEPPPEGCSAFVVIHEQHTCKTNEIKKLLRKAAERPRPYLFKGDHKYPKINENVPVAILYAEMGTKDFVKFHEILSEKAQNQEIMYVFRHYVQKPKSKKMYLSGYGVELAIKSTEYKVMDDSQVKATNETELEEDNEENEIQGFLFGKLNKIHPDLKDNLKELRKHLIESTKEMVPLKVWELQDISFQAASQIMSTPVYDALKLMKDISQNFPMKARSLTRIAVNQDMRKEIEENQKNFPEVLGIQPGDARLFINGLHIDLDVHDPFSILEILKSDGKVMHGLHDLGLSEKDLSRLLRLNAHSTDVSYALDIRHPSIIWINDIEKDDMYEMWPTSCRELLKPIFPGSIHQIRRNFYNLVLFVDPVQEMAADFVKVAELFYHHKIPLRIGFVFILNTDDKVDGKDDPGVALWRTFNYFAEEDDITRAFISIINMYHKVKKGETLTVDNVKSVLQNEFPHADLQEILGVDSEYDEKRKAGATFYKMTGLGSLPQALFNGVPFNSEEVVPEEMETVILQKIMDTTEFFQRAVFMGLLNDQMNAIDFLMDQSNVVSRINPLVLGTERRYLNLMSTSVSVDIQDFSTFSYLDSQDKSAVIARNMRYLTKKDEDAVSAVTIWIIADFDKASGRQLLSNALKHMVLGPLAENYFYTEDFRLLEKITFRTSAEKIKAIVKDMKVNSESGSDLVMKVDALLSSGPKRMSRQEVKFLKDQHSIVKINPQENDAFYDVVAIVDPLTREAQKMAHLLIVLGQIVNMKLTMFMNCRSKLSEVPLKSFYRFVLEPELKMEASGILTSGPVAKFLEMPESPLLTLNMITPDNWLVEAVYSSCDLDNIHLEGIEGTVTAEYELENLLLEGHCFDINTGQPPRGLQFTLGMKNKPAMLDTIVMANLGYFQLKANPGAWTLRLRKGKSEDIYHINGHEGTDSPSDSDDVIVVLSNFKSKILKVQVRKKPDKINEDLLSDKNKENQGIRDSVSSSVEGIQIEGKDQTNQGFLNIFSVASGHLYERFLRIMMLSVLRHTKTPVKFWFLKNYLSPTFKDIIPHMAKEYGFHYELVQYRWPRWLHQQTEKQRIIWGYKILFLDVLFPLAVDKIIFVDADQIVRADLKELRDLDLGGAPYGYTPFCDSRTEMDGYRFWKTGYWASHLGKRKYHISALYVVDLKKFRKIAAGDRLRGQYQALSQDPNSLSNLDQDLPNNMIHQVAIKSLPQEWLWCETWCDDESKKQAKTIDLCNNPQTKEPKLEAAARIVPEWSEYDTELRQLIQRIEEGKKSSSKPTSKKGFQRDEL
ncbi:UDP-glucose:glycoprotein glucosyltransferase 2 [Tachyglossus aculeatus]|uniref:UDP-glucose:glycoprotein glucosyltransferase 2 n=1 Tax=Tachyglossus aculeatus TaxID=9261 RepID=UPI0018F6EEC6|nr:UDP-glucose:glycoprotein glucosyltransferase 2 [Tachyglossus aculeatus]